MSEFKVGDKVELISNNYRSFNSTGDIGTITEVDNEDGLGLARVEADGGIFNANWSAFDDLKLVE